MNFFPAFVTGHVSALVDVLDRAAGAIVKTGLRSSRFVFFVNRFGAVSTLLAAFFSLMLDSRFLFCRKSSDAASIEVMTW